MPELFRKVGSVVNAAATNFFWRESSNHTIALHLEQWANRRPDDPFLWFEGESWTVGQFNAAANRCAHAYARLGLGEGATVALLLDNRPAYLHHFYGLAKIGAIPALINPSLAGAALARAIGACEPELILCGGPLLAELERASGRLAGGATLYVDVEGGGEPPAEHRDWRELFERAPDHDPPETSRRARADIAAYVYTSGTTGLPKPALVKHHRLWRAGNVFGGVVRTTASDCLYCCLPLCHGNASMIAAPIAIVHHCRLALARRFSARRFWSDCRDSGATIFIYVGELCRYLYNQPPSRADRDHQVTRALGNGLRADIWERFCERFGIERIAEYYAATEGNAETVNMFNRTGSCGPLLPSKMALARYDVQEERLVRNERGFCERAAAGEPGLLLGAIKARNDFDGYTDAAATRAKVLENVFKEGDRWFNTGDLLRRDRLFHLYFVDRLGDTFRWKGENVSTQEVAEALCQIAAVRECAVYGVQVPGMEGRAGMAAIVRAEDGSKGAADELDGAAFFERTARLLPAHARPRFLRLVGSLAITATFKHCKLDLLREGYDLARVSDPLYIYDARAGSYVPLTDAITEDLRDGRWPL